MREYYKAVHGDGERDDSDEFSSPARTVRCPKREPYCFVRVLISLVYKSQELNALQHLCESKISEIGICFLFF